MTAYAAGRLVNHCAHNAGWTHAAGESYCDRCGTRRFTEYGAVRPAGLPHAVVPAARDQEVADRSAAANVRWRMVDHTSAYGPPWRTS
ncbi:DUF6255 family natural product biosynthesis protein [Streptomyces sp. NPDC046261]|uniref:DUF6255 family natural product biosynthesis protein n=1 Tax=Streptomyces sp. NPDC046261 TaxID=3157200 RepID=UPI0033EC8B6C